MALHSIYPENRYIDYATKWADGFKWGMRADNTTTRNADNYCASQAYTRPIPANTRAAQTHQDKGRH